LSSGRTWSTRFGQNDRFVSDAQVVASRIGLARFIASCARLGQLRWKAIVIEATCDDMKSPYDDMGGLETDAHPNGVVGTLDAIEAKFGIPVLYTSQFGTLAEERAASWLSKHFTYWWLEEHGYGRVLIDADGL
jgi:hypothetical protein